MLIIDSFWPHATYLSSVDPQREFNSRPATGYVPVEFWKKTGMCLSAYRLHVLTDLCQCAAYIWGKGGCLITTSSYNSRLLPLSSSFPTHLYVPHVTLQVKNLECLLAVHAGPFYMLLGHTQTLLRLPIY